MGLMTIECRQCPYFDVDEAGQAMCNLGVGDRDYPPENCPLLKPDED